MLLVESSTTPQHPLTINTPSQSTPPHNQHPLTINRMQRGWMTCIVGHPKPYARVMCMITKSWQPLNSSRHKLQAFHTYSSCWHVPMSTTQVCPVLGWCVVCGVHHLVCILTACRCYCFLLSLFYLHIISTTPKYASSISSQISATPKHPSSPLRPTNPPQIPSHTPPQSPCLPCSSQYSPL